MHKVTFLVSPPGGGPGFLSPELGEAAFERLMVNFNKAQAAANIYGHETDKLKDTARDLGLSFSSAFEDAIAGGKKFSEVLRGLEMDTLRIVTRNLITVPFADAISKSVQSSGFFSGIGDFFKGIFGRQHGGPVSAGMPYVVGEAGPEVFVPPVSGSIVPAAAAGGISLSQTFVISGPVDRRSQQQIAAAAYDGAQRAFARNG